MLHSKRVLAVQRVLAVLEGSLYQAGIGSVWQGPEVPSGVVSRGLGSRQAALGIASVQLE